MLRLEQIALQSDMDRSCPVLVELCMHGSSGVVTGASCFLHDHEAKRELALRFLQDTAGSQLHV